MVLEEHVSSNLPFQQFQVGAERSPRIPEAWSSNDSSRKVDDFYYVVSNFR
jgi:hypothetical protein